MTVSMLKLLLRTEACLFGQLSMVAAVKHSARGARHDSSIGWTTALYACLFRFDF